MGLHDTFDFDEAAYALKTSQRPTDKLQEEEIKKLRQHFAASCSIGAGLGHAVGSAGISLGVSAWGARRYYVAKKKLEIIRKELQRRKVPLHDMTKRDAAIPITAALAGMGLGAEIGHAVGGLVTGPSLPADVAASHMAQAHIVAGDAANATHGFVQGMADQANAVGHAVNAEVAGALAGHGAAEAASNAVGDGHAVGYVAGIIAAKKTEEFIAECVGEAVFAYALEKLLDPEIKAELRLQGKCSRLLGPLGQYCRGCGDSIREGRFAHCCAGMDDYDLCINCFSSGTSCPCSDRKMLVMQKSVAGDVVLSERGDAHRRLTTTNELNCCRCKDGIVQGRYYYCPSCNLSNDGYDICEGCYSLGHTCETPDEHRLYVYLRANVPENVSPYGQAASGNIDCKGCEKPVPQGPYFHCSRCGKFDICERCYELGRTCEKPDAGHIFDRYNAYSGEKSISFDNKEEKDCCQYCKVVVDHLTGPFYRCSQCNHGNYDLCGACYTKGAGCQDRTHALTKCTIA